MEIIDQLQLFEDICYNHCITTGKRTISFDFNDEEQTTISYQLDVGFVLFDNTGWKIGKCHNIPKHRTDPDIMKTLKSTIESGVLSQVELEKHMISIT